MGVQVKPRSPVLQRGHPLARGLVGAWVMGEGAGTTVRDVARGNDGTFAGTTGLPTWSNSRTGAAVTFGAIANAHRITAAAIDVTSWTAASVAVLFRCDAIATGRMIFTLNHSSNDDIRLFQQPTGGGTPNKLTFTTDDGTAYNTNSVGNTNDGNWHLAVGVFDGGTVYLYVDGILNDSTGSASFNFATAGGTLGLGYRASNNSLHYEDDVGGGVWLYDRALIPTEIRTHYADPFAMDRPQVPVWVVGTAAAGGDLSVNVSDSVTVGESTTAIISEVLLSASDSVTIGESVVIAASAVLMAASDSVTVGESTTAVVSAVLVSASDSVTIGESTTAIVSAVLVSASDSITVGEADAISVAAVGDVSVGVSDAVTVGESTALVVSAVLVTASDSVTVGESSAVGIGVISVSVSDSITTGDTASAIVSAVLISVSDTIAIGDTSIVSGLSLDLSVDVSDSVTIGESSSPSLPPRRR